MRINYNVSAMLANNALANNDNLLAQSLERLSSGLKINHAKDNPSGLAMAKRMNAQIEGLSMANQNASDGISIIETADGAMTEIVEMLQRMNELAVKAANDTMTDEDRRSVQSEVAQLSDEIDRIANSTEFNGQKLLNGEFEHKGYVTGNLDVKVSSYSDKVAIGSYTIQEIVIDEVAPDSGEYMVKSINLGAEFPEGLTTEMKDKLLTLKSAGGFEMTLDLSDVDLTNVPKSITSRDLGTPLEIDVTGIGAMRLQIGSNEGQILAVEIPAVSLRNMGIEDINVSTGEAASEAINSISDAIQYVSLVRGKLGAYQNRLESTTNSLDITSENMTAAYSRIMDVDMAEEMTEYTTYQVLTQAGTSMLAQANERPSQVLQLLQ